MGRGLGALFLDNDHENPDEIRDIVREIDSIGAPKPDGSDVVQLKTVDIEPNKGQPRKNFDEDKLTALKESIQEHGVISPILVTPTKSGTYRIVAGERRWRASKLAGLKTVPCIIRS
ncbi:MAG: ParB/RepB/Spo0J family partition protein, partial [Clostridia bacterium]|nr:ParB/RepB/Spo0J family partition protein [Clostridia bacterium]